MSEIAEVDPIQQMIEAEGEERHEVAESGIAAITRSEAPCWIATTVAAVKTKASSV